MSLFRWIEHQEGQRVEIDRIVCDGDLQIGDADVDIRVAQQIGYQPDKLLGLEDVRDRQ